MGSLASRILGREVLTLHEFAYEVEARLAYLAPELAVTHPRPAIVAVAAAGKPPVEFNVQPSYRAYQKDPRAKDQIIARLLDWIESSTAAR